jgi:hypothetical protein
MVVKSLLNFNLPHLRKIFGPSLKAGAHCCFLVLLLISACSTITIPTRGKRKGSVPFKMYREVSTKDFADHLASLKRPLITSPGVKVIELNDVAEKYLRELAVEIISRNEIFFRDLTKAQVTIIDTAAPLHFSLPRGEIFLSRGLVSKYIKHESMLVSILAYELVRSEKLLYPREIIIPVGFVSIERMLSLSRLSLDEKMEVHKWAYHLTIRSGYDGEYYLSWLQIQNRNTADFLLQVGDPNLMTREESLFKAFLIKNSASEVQRNRKNSSKNFYTLVNTMREGTL